ncbi:MAG TPA: glycosyltransferase family 39 protein [Acidimicrobiia bacterium]
MTLTPRNFARWLAVIALGGLIVRVLYVLVERRDFTFVGDAVFYHEGANLLADGRGFISPFELASSGRAVEAADHPPLHMLWLTIPSFVGIDTELSHLLWSCLLGAGTIVLVGLLGSEVAGPRVGLVAAAIAAVYPNIWWHDGALMSETMAIFTATLAVWLAYRYRRDATIAGAVALGVACALAALTRAELILLLPFVVLPLVLRAPAAPVDRRARLVRLGAAGGAAVITLAPWVGFNLARFENPVLISTGFELTLNIANCDDTYYGPLTGYFSIECARPTAERARRAGLDQSEEATRHRREALEYIGDHKSRVPVVVAARWGRITGLYRLDQLTTLATVEGQERWVAVTGMASLWLLAALAAVGVVVLRRRRVPVYPLLALVLIVFIAVAISYAPQRFRASAEPAVVVLAAVGIDAAVRRIRTRRNSIGAP